MLELVCGGGDRAETDPADEIADGLRLQLVSDGFQLPKVESEQPAGRKR